jgi:hypothetical protein
MTADFVISKRPKAGQKQRFAPGEWERATNRQQRKNVKVFDAWAAELKRDLRNKAAAGATPGELADVLASKISNLQERFLEVTNKGIATASRISASSRADLPAIKRVAERLVAENTVMVTNNLVPKIHEELLVPIAVGVQANPQALNMAIANLRFAPAQYAGGYWVAIFETQKQLGTMRETERAAEGLQPEPIRWVLDPNADHCVATPDKGGFYGCPDLAKQYPHWSAIPTVPGGHTTCRGNCVIEGTMVDAFEIEAAYRLPYAGPVLEFTTKSGLQLTVTPNHPILTWRGWVKAQFLNEGDDVISGPYSKTISQAINGDNDYIPVRIEKIFDAFDVTDSTNRFRHSFVAMPQDFHGDGRFVNGNVDIVRTDRQLLNEADSFDFEHSREFIFSGRSLRQGNLTRQSPGVQISGCSLQSLDSGMSCRTDLKTFFGRHFTHANEHGITSSAWFNTMLDKLVPESTTTDTRNQRQLLFALAREITLDKIVNVRNYNYFGHVFDLQSFGSLYNANGVVVHNCRCHLEVFRDGQWRRGVYED